LGFWVPRHILFLKKILNKKPEKKKRKKKKKKTLGWPNHPIGVAGHPV
jgi:hypothetical protein